MFLKLQYLTTRLYPNIIKHMKMSQVGELGSGAGKGGGGGGTIREAGGAFGKMEAAREEEYFYKQQQEQLNNLKVNANAPNTDAKTTAKSKEATN